MSGDDIQKESVFLMWDSFLKENPDNPVKTVPESFYFCDNQKDADECADLVVKGVKQATATSLWWFEKNNEKLPVVDNQYVVTRWNGEAVAIIQTTKVEKVPYSEITEEFARTEGEGDKSLSYWRKVHKAYYSREMAPFNEEFDENMIIICEYFKKIYPAR